MKHRPLVPLLLAALPWLAGCAARAEKSKAPAPRPVQLVRAEPRSLPRTLTAVGALAAEERAEMSFKVAGRLKRMAVDIGSQVTAGQVLAELEPTDFRLRAERARAALLQARARLGLAAQGESDDVRAEQTATVKQARAKMEEAAAQLARSKSLLAEGVLSQSTFDVVEANYKVAESQYNDSLEEVNTRRGVLAERRSDVALADQQLRDAVLTAPFTGAVQQRRASLGEYLAAGAPVLTLVKLHPIRLRMDVPERESRSVRQGQVVTVRLEGDTVAHRGVVARISPALEELSRSLIVEAEIPNPTGRLRPGSFARAEIAVDSGSPAPVVPETALVVFAGIEKVVTGRRAAGFVEIVSGLEPGTPVIDKPGNLTTGMPVQAQGGAL